MAGRKQCPESRGIARKWSRSTETKRTRGRVRSTSLNRLAGGSRVLFGVACLGWRDSGRVGVFVGHAPVNQSLLVPVHIIEDPVYVLVARVPVMDRFEKSLAYLDHVVEGL
jgi:hypothetical protein